MKSMTTLLIFEHVVKGRISGTIGMRSWRNLLWRLKAKSGTIPNGAASSQTSGRWILKCFSGWVLPLISG